MSELLNMLLNRRSVRVYTGEAIPEDKLKLVLQAGLLSESGHKIRPWEFVVIQDRDRLLQLTACKKGAGKMLENAGAAIIVLADQQKSDVWIDDCAITMANMHLMADSIGLGSCYINTRMREAVDGGDTETFVKNFLSLPDKYRVVAILSLGILINKPLPHSLERLHWEKVHYDGKPSTKANE
ncbi:MAG: nitroreductase family protein [Lachnospiraceae bacterium]